MSLKSFFGAKGYKVLKNGIWSDHPICSTTLGVCSALAITNKIENAIAMSCGVLFVLLMTALLISTLRKLIPSRVRIITYMITLATCVTIVDKFLNEMMQTVSK